MSTELKPCPFCGGTNLGFSSKTVARKYGSCRAYHGAIYCKKCNAYGARVLSETIKNVYPMPDVDFDELERRAVEAWNRRTPEIVKIETNIYDKEEIYPDCTNRRFHIPDLADICMSAEEFCCLGERKENER